MSDVKWIKINIDMFSNRKIKYLRKLPEGNSIVLIWVMLLTMAGRCNAGGLIIFTENIPYTVKMLADELKFEENTVKLALEALEYLYMIETDDGKFWIPGWEEYQNTDKLAELREYNRKAKQKSRAKLKELPAVNDMSMTSQECQGTDIDIEKDIEVDLEKDTEDKEIDVEKSIIEYLNAKANTRFKASSSKTKKLIQARISEGYTVDDFISVIDKKCAEWIGNEFEQYLRPETLFGNKFEGYLNAKVNSKKRKYITASDYDCGSVNMADLDALVGSI